jgi:hypothetical protein
VDFTQIIVSLFVFAGLVVTQWGLHKRWVTEQKTQREESLTKYAEERKTEFATMLSQVGEQSRKVFEDAFNMIEVHRADASAARLQMAEQAVVNAECKQEIAHLTGRVEELRVRLMENERTHTATLEAIERHRLVKHDALNALSVSEGTMVLVQRLLPNCTCGAFAPIAALVERFEPRAAALLDENNKGVRVDGVMEGIGRIEATAATVAEDLALRRAAEDERVKGGA